MAEQPLPEGTDTIIDGAGKFDDEPEIDTPSSTGDDYFTAETGPVDPATASALTGGAAAGQQQGTKDTNGASSGSSDDDAAASGDWFERIQAFRSQGYDTARDYAVQGKDRATGALDELLQTINDAAGQIDGKIGSQYGDYARKAAESLGGFNDALKGKDVDELFNDARTLIAKAPAVAVGTAALLGFVIARLAKAGLDDGSTSGDTKA